VLVEHFERVILFRLFVLDEQDATERAGAKRPFTIEVFQPSVVLPRPAHGNNHTTRSVHGRRVRPTRYAPPAANDTGTALGQDGSDGSRDPATLTFDLGGHGACG